MCPSLDTCAVASRCGPVSLRSMFVVIMVMHVLTSFPKEAAVFPNDWNVSRQYGSDVFVFS